MSSHALARSKEYQDAFRRGSEHAKHVRLYRARMQAMKGKDYNRQGNSYQDLQDAALYHEVLSDLYFDIAKIISDAEAEGVI